MRLSTRIGMKPAAVLLAFTLTGCVSSDSDKELAEFAKETMTEQRKQNDRLAEQSAAIVEKTGHLTQAAEKLVEQDAEARRELIAAQQQLQSELHQQQSTVDAHRKELEDERQQIASQRGRDPIVANAITNSGLMLACVLPLVVCVMVIRQLQHQQPDDAAVAELLLHEATQVTSTLLPFTPFSGQSRGGSKRLAQSMTEADRDQWEDQRLYDRDETDDEEEDSDPPF